MITLRPSPNHAATTPLPMHLAKLRGECLSTERSDSTQRNARHASARELGKLAFRQSDRQAWELAQSVVWQLMRRERFRPVDPSDVEVLGELFRLERESQVVSLPSKALSDDEFLDALDSELDNIFAEGRFHEETLTGFEIADWQFLFHNFVPSVWDFTTLIALASVQLPLQLALPLYENLYDEGGRGGTETWHRKLFVEMMEALDSNVPDLDSKRLHDIPPLEHVVPESIAEFNSWCSALWSREPGAALGALYAVEKGVPGYYPALERQLRKFGLAEPALHYVAGHQEIDVHHAEEWRSLLARLIGDDPSQRNEVFRGAVLSASWDVLAWQSIMESWSAWKSGAPFPNVHTTL